MNHQQTSIWSKVTPGTAGITSGRQGTSTANTYEYASNMGGYPVSVDYPNEHANAQLQSHYSVFGAGGVNPGETLDKQFASTMNASGKTGAFNPIKNGVVSTMARSP